ncbi:hypothetical protein ACLB2K_007544 [Fragaria x ananassa]
MLPVLLEMQGYLPLEEKCGFNGWRTWLVPASPRPKSDCLVGRVEEDQIRSEGIRSVTSNRLWVMEKEDWEASFESRVGLVGTLDIGVCYGTMGDNLPAATYVVNLYKQHDISKIRLFNPVHLVLDIQKGSGIGVTLGIPNVELEHLATTQAFVDI